MAGGTGHIIQSLIANMVIAAAKAVGAVITGSGAMLAETIHSGADCGNQLLLLMGVKRSKKAPDEMHPLGYGRALYFWSFMVAVLLFVGGGAFSIYEGIHKIQEPEKLGSITLALIILGLSILIEGWATLSNVVEMNKRRRQTPFFRYLRETKDSDLVVVFGENLAAVVGLVLAAIAVVVAKQTGDGRWDGIGSLAIGAVLIVVAVFLAVEVKGLLVGEAADPKIGAAARRLAEEDPRLDRVLQIITVQQGPGEVVVAAKIACKRGLSAADVCDLINDFEQKLRIECPEVKWCFVEPDVRSAASAA